MKFNWIISSLRSYFTVNIIYHHLHDKNNSLNVAEGKNRAEIHSLKRLFVENADIIKMKIQQVYLLLGFKGSANNRIRDGIHLSGQKSKVAVSECALPVTQISKRPEHLNRRYAAAPFDLITSNKDTEETPFRALHQLIRST